MPIDPATEVLLPLAEAAGRLPRLRGGRAVATSTVWRWARRGVRGRGGALVRLEVLKLGGTCCTSDEALLRFFRTLSADDPQPPGAPASPGPKAGGEVSGGEQVEPAPPGGEG
jgi:hypothetical protein